MAEDTSHYAVVAVDEEGRQLARLLDGYIAPQVARVMAMLGVPDQLGRAPLPDGGRGLRVLPRRAAG
jgi:hypothetical protein